MIQNNTVIYLFLRTFRVQCDGQLHASNQSVQRPLQRRVFELLQVRN